MLRLFRRFFNFRILLFLQNGFLLFCFIFFGSNSLFIFLFSLLFDLLRIFLFLFFFLFLGFIVLNFEVLVWSWARVFVEDKQSLIFCVLGLGGSGVVLGLDAELLFCGSDGFLKILKPLHQLRLLILLVLLLVHHLLILLIFLLIY